MKISKRSLSIMLVFGVMICSKNTYATQVNTPKTITAVKNNLESTATTSQIAYITFDKDEYVRVTQPTISNTGETIVFNNQMNIMGEARVGTNITIDVYTKDKVSKDPFTFYKSYEVPEVGATQTFNQLIDLKVGQNKIVITYTHKQLEDKDNSIDVGIITRESEEVKEDIKNSIPDLKQPFLKVLK